MAYDQKSAYAPPNRSYQGQQQQQQQQVPYGYGNGYEEQSGGYDQSYEQGYNHGHSQQRYYGQQSAQPQGANGAYEQGHRERRQEYQQQQAPSNGYGQPEQRQYDPRYQQRQPRGPPQGQGQHPSQRARPPPVTQGRGVPLNEQPRPPMGNGQPQKSHRRQDTFEQQSADLISPPRPQGNGEAPRAAPRVAPAAPQQSQPAKMTMEEWKKREREKLHAASMLPETLAQDNAFPMFPGLGKPDSRPSSRGGSNSAMGVRKSMEENARPGTSQSRPSVSTNRSAHDSARPNMGRSESYGSGKPGSQDLQSPPQRPNLAHKPSSYDRGMDRTQQQHTRLNTAQNVQRRPSAQEQAATPTERQQPQQQPLPPASQNDQRRPSAQDPAANYVERQQPQQQQSSYSQVQQPPQQQARPYQQPTPQQESYGQRSYASDTLATRDDQRAYERPRQQPQPTQALARRPAPGQRLDSNNSRAPPQSSQYGYQPMSPASAPTQQIATYASSREPISPTYVHPQSTPQYDTANAVPPPRTWATSQQPKHTSLTDIYGDYHEAAPPVNQPATKTRDEEIEAEMPDFDSAAPGQTSSLHKRSQTIEKHLAGSQENEPAPPMPALPVVSAPQHRPASPNHSVRSMPAQINTHPQDDMQGLDQKQRNGGITAGFAFEFEEQQRQHEYGQRSPYENDRSAPPQQVRPQMGPPQPLYANEQRPRRSADDTRQPRRAPQAQAYYANGQPARELVPPHAHRPDLDRAFSGQTVFSDPGVQRAGSVPPPRSALQAPPLQAQYGSPLSQQRSAPEQSSHPDSLPHHPVPVRPGLMNTGAPQQPSKPPPVRQHSLAQQPQQQVPQQQKRQASIDQTPVPVTRAELDKLKQYVADNPNNPRQAFLLVKKLVEAAAVLASENGRLDAKATAKNREKYMLEAHKRLKKLVNSAYPDAMFYMADCYGQGSLGLENDPKEAFNLYLAAAKQGHPQAAYRTAICCELGPDEGGGTRKDVQKAVQWYKRAAVLGDNAAMYKVGVIALKALMGQPRNVGEAVTWLKRAVERADKEHPHALHELGMLFDPTNAAADAEIRNKVIPDENYARELFKQAAQLNYKQSQFRLGQAYEYGNLGLPIDNRASISWYTKAAAQGEHQAELALSGWYLTGAEGILEHSDTEAYLWARKAASSEPPLAKAMFAMGYFSEQGIGCPASVEEARRWYGRAAAHKFPKAIERIEELRRTGGKAARPQPANGKLTRKDQKRDEAECALM